MNDYDSQTLKKNSLPSNRFNSSLLQPPINATSKRAILKRDYDDFLDNNSVSKTRKKAKGSSR